MQKLGGITTVYENGFVTLCRGIWKMRVMKAAEIPLTFGGKATFMIQNILPAIIAANVQGFSMEDIRAALLTFIPSETQTPGRMNLFKFKNFDVLVDYAHNPAGMRALKDFTDTYNSSTKVGIIAGVGDRRDEDTQDIGRIATEMFDEIIIRQDKNLRGKTKEEIIALLKEGISQHANNVKVTLIPSEKKAILYAVNNAQKDSLIVLCSDVIPEALQLVKELKEEESSGEKVFGLDK